MHADTGKELLTRMAEETEELGVVERKPRLEGMQMIMILAPLGPRKREANSDAKDENAT